MTDWYILPALNELLFEGYNVPQAAFAIDGLMSFYNNLPDQPDRDGIVLSFNSASTSVIPVLNGRGILSDCKRYEILHEVSCDVLISSCRIPWGAIQASEYLLKIVQMKYPYFLTRVTPQQSAVRIAPQCIDAALSSISSGCSGPFANSRQIISLHYAD